jgi:hypothetical protein
MQIYRLRNSKTKYRVASGDLPEVDVFGEKLSMVDIRKYEKLDKRKVVNLDQVRCRGRESHELPCSTVVELPNELHICSNRIGQIPSSPYIRSTWWYIVLPGVRSLCFCRAQEGENTTSRPDLVVVVAMTRHGLLTRWGPFLRVTAKHKASY